MKICFLLQRRFAYMGHALAYHIQQASPDTQFCGVVQLRTSYDYLRTQQDIAYTGLLFEEELHAKLYDETIDLAYLAWLEKEYGIPNLWPYLYIDRVLMHGQLRREYPYDEPLLTRDEMLKRLQVTAKAIIEFLDTERPDAVVFSVIGSMASMLLYHIAKKRGIQTILIHLALIQNRVGFTEDYRTFNWVRARFEELQSGARRSPLEEEARQYIEEFRKKPAPYLKNLAPDFNFQAHRSANFQFLAPAHLWRSARWYTGTLYRELFKNERYYDDIPVRLQLWDKLKRRVRGIRGFERYYSRINPAERYAFYPLHQEPETALLLYAPYQADQLAVIKAAAHALPIDMLLYVKEHPEMVGYRTRKYYREITKIPNVRLIDPRTTSYELIAKAALTFTITGTVGWESVLFKKPVITFGDVFFNDLSFVRHCENFNELPFLVRDALSAPDYDERELLNYVAALVEDTVSVEYMKFMWYGGGSVEEMKQDEGVRRLGRLLGEKTRCIKTR